MNITSIPKDILTEIIKQNTLCDIVMLRQVCKHFNNVIKNKMHRMWFCKYIKKIATTKEYAYKYNVVVPKIHDCFLVVNFVGKIDIERHNHILKEGGYEAETR